MKSTTKRGATPQAKLDRTEYLGALGGFRRKGSRAPGESLDYLSGLDPEGRSARERLPRSLSKYDAIGSWWGGDELGDPPDGR